MPARPQPHLRDWGPAGIPTSSSPLCPWQLQRDPPCMGWELQPPLNPQNLPGMTESDQVDAQHPCKPHRVKRLRRADLVSHTNLDRVTAASCAEFDRSHRRNCISSQLFQRHLEDDLVLTGPKNTCISTIEFINNRIFYEKAKHTRQRSENK